MKRLKRLLLVLGALVAVFVFLQFSGRLDGAVNDENAPTPFPTTIEVPTDPDRAGDSLLVPPAIADEARTAELRRLADGDSFDIFWTDTGDRDEVRLFGINAPEGGACFGDEARSALDGIVADQTLFVEAIERDEFGRLIANVWTGDVFVNAAMVERGAALALSDGGSHAELIADAQDLAEATQAGLWSPSACGSDGETNVVIGTIKFDAKGPDNEFPNDEWIELVNISAEPADLTGWSVRDESTRNRYSFPEGFVLASAETVVVHSGCGDDTLTDLYWCAADPVWNNSGDTGFLVDTNGHFVDTFAYGG